MSDSFDLNQEHDIDLEIKPTKGLIAGVAVVALLIVAGFISFNLFFKSNTPKTITPEPETNNESVLGSQTTPSAGTAPSQGQNQAQPQGQTNGQSSNTQTGQATTPTSRQVQGQTTSTWSAVYHTGGSITGENYTVQKGDTLWEIARGRYGTALDWKKVAEANNISYDSLGHPILHSGDVLKLP